MSTTHIFTVNNTNNSNAVDHLSIWEERDAVYIERIAELKAEIYRIRKDTNYDIKELMRLQDNLDSLQSQFARFSNHPEKVKHSWYYTLFDKIFRG